MKRKFINYKGNQNSNNLEIIAKRLENVEDNE